MRSAGWAMRHGAAENAGRPSQDRRGKWGRQLAWLLPMLLPIALVGAAWAADSGGSLAGRVALGAEGLPGVMVTATGPTTVQAVTTLDGSYLFRGLPAGNYSLVLTQDGFRGDPPVRTVVLSGTGVQGLDFLATPVAPLLPTIRLAPSATQIRPGDTFTLRLSLTPGTQEPRADLHLSLVPPGAPLRPESPWQANLLVPAVTDAPVFSHTLTGEEPPGAYTWLAFLTRPGTMDLLGPVGIAMVTVQP